MYIYRGIGVFIDVYKADDKIATSGTTSLADIDLRRTYKSIGSAATGVYLLYSVFVVYFRTMRGLSTVFNSKV